MGSDAHYPEERPARLETVEAFWMDACPVTNREFSKALGRVLRRPAIAPVPRAALVAMRGEELTEQILGSLRVIPRRALDLGFSFGFAEIEPALRDLLRT